MYLSALESSFSTQRKECHYRREGRFTSVGQDHPRPAIVLRFRNSRADEGARRSSEPKYPEPRITLLGVFAGEHWPPSADVVPGTWKVTICPHP